MIKPIQKNNKVYTNKELTDVVQNLVMLLENVNGILASHQACLEALIKKLKVIKQDKQSIANTTGDQNA